MFPWRRARPRRLDATAHERAMLGAPPHSRACAHLILRRRRVLLATRHGDPPTLMNCARAQREARNGGWRPDHSEGSELARRVRGLAHTNKSGRRHRDDPGAIAGWPRPRGLFASFSPPLVLDGLLPWDDSRSGALPSPVRRLSASARGSRPCDGAAPSMRGAALTAAHHPR